MSKDKAQRESFLKIIQEWKWYWMNQTQNSEADYLNYQRRAHGIDANMKYDLADRLADREDALEAKLAECVAALEFYADRESWNIAHAPNGKSGFIKSNDFDEFNFGGRRAREVLAKVKK